KAFQQLPELRGKSWARAQRPPGAFRERSAANLPTLVLNLSSPDRATRASAALELALLGLNARPAMSRLVRALGDSDPVIRQTVMTALPQGGRPAPEDLQNLLPALDSPSAEAKLYVLEALAVIGDQPEAAPGVEAVLKATGDADPRVRAQALRAVGMMVN